MRMISILTVMAMLLLLQTATASAAIKTIPAGYYRAVVAGGDYDDSDVYAAGNVHFTTERRGTVALTIDANNMTLKAGGGGQFHAWGDVVVNGRNVVIEPGAIVWHNSAKLIDNSPAPEPEPQPEPEPEPEPNPPTPAHGKWYALQATNRQSVTDQELEQCDGLAVRYTWEFLTTVDGRAMLQRDLDRCDRLDKTIALKLFGGVFSPPALTTAGPTFSGEWNSNSGGRGPVPWRADYQDGYAAILKTVAAMPRANRIVLVSAPGPNNAELWWKHTDIYSKSRAAEKLEAAHLALANSIDAAFPTAVIVVCKGDVEPWQDSLIAKLSAKYGQRAGVQINSLSAKTSTNWSNYVTIKEHAGPKGFQMLCGSSQDRFGGTWDEAIAKGDAAGAQWYEIYREDLGKTR